MKSKDRLVFTLFALIFLFSLEHVLRVINEPDRVRVFVENQNGTGSIRLRPNAFEESVVAGNTVQISINAHGMHWPEVETAKKPGVVRVAFVGDSHVFGSWASSIDNSMVGVAATTIEAQLPYVEVLNFGVGGYGIDEVFLLLEEVIEPFDPDFVVLGFSNGTDHRDTFLGKDKYYLNDGILKWNDKLLSKKLPDEYREKKRRKVKQPLRFLRKFEVYKSIERLLGGVSSTVATEPNPVIDRLVPEAGRFRSNTFWSMSEYLPIGHQAVEATNNELDNILKWACAKDAGFLIFAIPYPDQVAVSSLTGKGYDASRPQKWIEDYAQSNELPYFDLSPTLRPIYHNSDKPMYLADSHFTESGHGIVGKLVGDFLVSELQSADVHTSCR